MTSSSFFKTSYPTVMIMLAALALLSLVGCDLAKNQTKIDRANNLEVQDYRDALSKRGPERKFRPGEEGKGGIPELSSYIDLPDGGAKPFPLVSVSVNENVPLRDVLYELAAQADYDLVLDPRISGAIIFSVRDRPLDQVLDSISEIAGLRYAFDDNLLRIELDTPYSRNYKIDYLPLVRTSESTIQATVSVTASGGGGETAGAQGGSSFSITNTADNDFWLDLEDSLTDILAAAERRAQILSTRTTPRLGRVRAENPPQGTSEDLLPPALPGSEASANASVPELIIEQIGDAVDNAAGEEQVVDAAQPAEGEPVADFTPYFRTNRQAGFITVYADSKTHREVEKYIRELTRYTTAQVLIEAKVLEVNLTDEYRSGVRWDDIEVLNTDISLDFQPSPLPTLTGAASAPTTLFSIGFDDLEGGETPDQLLSFISRFGAVNALASPRLTVVNNQPAVLNVATNRVFFEIEVNNNQTDGVSSLSTESQVRTVPEGILINVFPSINLEDNTVTMTLRPTISRITTTVNDPGVALSIATAAAQATGVTADALRAQINSIQNAVPVVSVQEFDSVVRVNSGETLVLGGLLQDRMTATHVGVPGLSEAPLIGSMFRSKEDTIQKVEVVVFLKATILPQPGRSIHNTDRDIYKTFSSDRRPFSDLY